jgi:hypothetical protein
MDAHSKEGAVSITTPSFKASVDDLVVSMALQSRATYAEPHTVPDANN